MIDPGFRISCARMARRRSTRALGWPRDWNPGGVCDPRQDQTVFTEAGAWEFIADLLDDGCEVETKLLDSPPGGKGYVILTSGGAGKPDVYIKFQVIGNRIFGRSFHYTHHEKN